MLLWALGLSCETPAAVGPPVFHTTARELQTCTLKGPGASSTTKIPREDPQRERERKRTKMRSREGKNSAKFWASHPSGAPPFGAPPFGAPPFGLPPSGSRPSGPPPSNPSPNPYSLAPTFSRFGPPTLPLPPSTPHFRTHVFFCPVCHFSFCPKCLLFILSQMSFFCPVCVFLSRMHFFILSPACLLILSRFRFFGPH